MPEQASSSASASASTSTSTSASRQTKTASERLKAALAEQEKAVNMASTATGLIVSLCFFVLPLVWSNVFRILPIVIQSPSSSAHSDPWSEFKDL